jgi:uncharacterized membrane protein YhfC
MRSVGALAAFMAIFTFAMLLSPAVWAAIRNMDPVALDAAIKPLNAYAVNHVYFVGHLCNAIAVVTVNVISIVVSTLVPFVAVGAAVKYKSYIWRCAHWIRA